MVTADEVTDLLGGSEHLDRSFEIRNPIGDEHAETVTRALEIYRELDSFNHYDPELMWQIALLHRSMGIRHSRKANWEIARGHYRDSAAILDQLLADDSDNSKYCEAQGDIQRTLAENIRRANNRGETIIDGSREAEKLHRSSLDLLNRAVANSPSAQNQISLARAHVSYISRLLDHEQHEVAQTYLSEAKAILESVDDFPLKTFQARLLAKVYMAEGRVQRIQGHREQAEEGIQRGVELLEARLADDSNNVFVAGDLAFACYLLADLQLEMGVPDRAVNSLNRAIELREWDLTTNGENPRVRNRLEQARRLRAEALSLL